MGTGCEKSMREERAAPGLWEAGAFAPMDAQDMQIAAARIAAQSFLRSKNSTSLTKPPFSFERDKNHFKTAVRFHVGRPREA
jgi:hypothetical protein